MARTIIRITANSTRVEIAEAIRIHKADHDRLPEHFIDQRREIMDEIDALVDRWLEARA